MSKQRQTSVTVPSRPAPSLADFVQEKKRAHWKATCVICALPVEIRKQLGSSATKRGFSRQDQVDFLRERCGCSKVTLAILVQHLNERHDREEELNGAE